MKTAAIASNKVLLKEVYFLHDVWAFGHTMKRWVAERNKDIEMWLDPDEKEVHMRCSKEPISDLPTHIVLGTNVVLYYVVA